MFHLGCACCAPSRRKFLAVGLGAIAATKAAMEPALAAVKMAGIRPIDIHAHYYPERYWDVVREDGGRFGVTFTSNEQGFSFTSPAGSLGPLPMKFIDLKLRLADMDASGIAVQALSLTLPMLYWADAETAKKLAIAWNDGAVAAHQAYPDRFYVLAALPMLNPDLAIEELDRVVKLPGVRDVYMGTNINTRDLDDPLFEPIFAHIAKLNLPVFLHPVQTIGGKRLDPYYLSNLLGNPFDTAIAACHLIFGGVMDRHPNLTVNLPHAGGSFPMLIGRIDRGWQIRQETKSLPQAPSKYLRRFTYDTISHSKPIMDFIVKEVGVDRIVVGSDYCFDMGLDRPLEIVNQLSLTTAQRNMVLHGNAATLFKM